MQVYQELPHVLVEERERIGLQIKLSRMPLKAKGVLQQLDQTGSGLPPQCHCFGDINAGEISMQY